MGKLPWPRVRAMLVGGPTQVAASAWSFLQNLSHSSDVAPVQRPVLQWSQGELLQILHDVIRGAPLLPRCRFCRRARFSALVRGGGSAGTACSPVQRFTLF